MIELTVILIGLSRYISIFDSLRFKLVYLLSDLAGLYSVYNIEAAACPAFEHNFRDGSPS